MKGVRMVKRRKGEHEEKEEEKGEEMSVKNITRQENEKKNE